MTANVRSQVMDGRWAHLSAGGTSVLVVTDDARLPRIIHWGPDLGDLSEAEIDALVASGRPHIGDSPVTNPQPVPVLPQLAEGWMGRPGLVGDSRGTRWAPLFAEAEYDVLERPNGRALLCTARDVAYDLELRIEIDMDASGLVRQRATLLNSGVDDYRVDGLELAFPVPGIASEVLDLTGRWARERAPQRRPFDVGAWTRESRGGKPGLEHTLVLAAGEPGFGFRSGEVWAVHLGWSGNQVLVAERTPADVRHLGAGEIMLPGEVMLAEGESYVTPWLYGSWGRGLDEMAGRFHRFLRSRPEHPKEPRPVILNTWEAVYFDLDVDTLLRLADRGAAAGVERFVVDDGWFSGRRDDTRALGDWSVDTDVLPGGLGPIAERVHALGMEFGLWFEPEMVNLDSDLARAHPDWIFDAGHGAGLPSRHQHVLDLGHPQAYTHVFDRVSRLVAELGIDYIKWDHNRYLLDAGHTPTGRPGVRRQTLEAYRMMSELKRTHPGLEIESCASGGGRIDLGVLEFTDRVWPSDCNDPHERLEIQRWTSLVIPPELQGTHLGAERSHTTHRSHPLAYRAEKALWGHLGIELNLLKESDAVTGDVEAWVAFHKDVRELLHTGEVVHADLADAALRLEGVVAEDGSAALFAFSATDRPLTSPPGRIRFPGLDPQALYRIQPVSPTGDRGLAWPQWMHDGTELTGRTLAAVGVGMPALDPDTSVLFSLTRTAPHHESTSNPSSSADGAVKA